ncbi:putative bifunctional diguanylate cyclase/phosphodiesterase [Ectothiorhodospira mobilis]|uniref:putative bifunctional diguanylate cyclase/phosphodiesterase n=1 Tax=Ectothiorhodospira mobilis TaxID=195064 RepID=UPI0019035A67|nr:EAL domain-containing protein [Ectothiorhodospira mobilis]MBK1690785.1 diguanylate cyclase [Ectothiorhodospira mobilis]
MTVTEKDQEPTPGEVYLRERVRHLEEAAQRHQYALDVLLSITTLFGDHEQDREPGPILEKAHDCIHRLLSLEDAGYFLVDDASGFRLHYRPPGAGARADLEPGVDAFIDAFIEDGTFAWALNQNRPVCLPAKDNSEIQWVLHVIATRSRIRGMFVGRIHNQPLQRDDLGLRLLTLVLFHAAYALESADLYALLARQRQTLERVSRRQSEALAHQYSHDTLTDLPNRILFGDRLSQLLGSHQEQGERGGYLAVILMDLDHFKRINDSLGHRAGDRLLQQVATDLHGLLSDEAMTTRYRLRRAEITLSRLGGDEFGILLNAVESPDLAARVAHRLVQAVNREYEVEGHAVFLACSAGVSIHPLDGGDSETLIKNADAALHEAKRQGRNGYHFYTREMNSQSYRYLVLENALAKALSRDQLEIHYQPQICLASGRVRGMEALLRWEHPQEGMLSPPQFIPIAEETGLIEGLGAWVMQRVCRDLQRLEARGLRPEWAAVNLSPRQFRQADLVQTYRDILRRRDIPPQWIELELTESTLMQDVDAAVNSLRQLHHLGFRLAVDDFGTGYSSLSHLKNFPIHTLKVDRTFVQDAPEDANDAAIVTAIVAMAKGLGLEVIAEGVETPEQLAFVQALDCSLVQGFYYARPAPLDTLIPLLETPGGDRLHPPH